jgi:hypothetical protein
MSKRRHRGRPSTPTQNWRRSELWFSFNETLETLDKADRVASRNSPPSEHGSKYSVIATIAVPGAAT